MNIDLDLAWKLIPLQLWNTIYMVLVSTFFATIIGLPIGVILTINSSVYKGLSILVNIGRSIPFAILMVALIPFTRLLIGTSLGTTASIVPLTIAAAPFVARLIETSLKGVDKHIIEAALVMGSTKWQIITKVFLPEALPSIIHAITLTAVNLVGYSAMAGLVGGGGLGQVAIQYGYQRFNTFIMILTIVILIILVQLIQWIGNWMARMIVIKRGQHFHE